MRAILRSRCRPNPILTRQTTFFSLFMVVSPAGRIPRHPIAPGRAFWLRWFSSTPASLSYPSYPGYGSTAGSAYGGSTVPPTYGYYPGYSAPPPPPPPPPPYPAMSPNGGLGTGAGFARNGNGNGGGGGGGNSSSSGSELMARVGKYLVRLGVLLGILAVAGYLASPGRSTRSSMLDSMFEAKFEDQSGKVPDIKFDDVKGCDEVKEELQTIVEFLKSPQKFQSLGARLPKGVLLTGPPGTGKTMLAKAIAHEAGVPFFYASGSEFDEVFVGLGAKRVRELFSAAKKNAPSVIFVDEIDSVGSKRQQNATFYGSNQTLNQILAELDGFRSTEPVVVIAATNHGQVLDKALTRPGRFDLKVPISPPDVRGREEVLQLYLSRVLADDNVDVKTLARGTPGFVGADLQNLVNQAAIIAGVQNSPTVGMNHLELAKDKVIMGSQWKGKIISLHERTTTAYHEGGHALVALETEGADPLYKATILPRGQALGATHQLPVSDEVQYSTTRERLFSQLCVCMGGRVAEELIFGKDKVTSGSANDLSVATNIADKMVRECGMSDKLGPLNYEAREDGRYLYSEATRGLIEGEIKQLVTDANARARGILSSKLPQLHALAQGLLEYETLTAAEMRQVIRGQPLSKAQPIISKPNSNNNLNPTLKANLNNPPQRTPPR